MTRKISVQAFLPVLTVLFIFFSSFKTFAQTPFITVWKTDNPGGLTPADQIQVPLSGSYVYSWEDIGTPAINGSGTGSGQLNLTFPTAGSYRLSLTPSGSVPLQRISFANNVSNDAAKLIGLEQWGNIAWSSMYSAFTGAGNLVSITATDLPDLSKVSSMQAMFYNCTALADINRINEWNTSTVTDMSLMFRNVGQFNQDIGGWNVSKVTSMREMFFGASQFNQDISNWNVGDVTDMRTMFRNAGQFNQNIGSWDVSKVTSMKDMFFGASQFNQDISNWNVGNVTDMRTMFRNAVRFNQGIGGWNVSNVTSMAEMFFGAAQFNQDISNWNVGNVTDMSLMFRNAGQFNQNIGNWDVSKVTSMREMFFGASQFNQDISNWNVGNVTDMQNMFRNAVLFNQNIAGWNVSAVANMANMFSGAAAFNQNLGSWNLAGITTNPATANDTGLGNMLSASGLNCLNYGNTLKGWATASTTPANITLGAGGRTYGPSAVSARSTLTSTKGWTIQGDTYDAACPESAALPVKFLYFAAAGQGTTVLLQWSTAFEQDNSVFEIQRSTDGNNWEVIGFRATQVAGGNSIATLTYNFTDQSPYRGINQYRLKQIDIDGRYEYSQVRVVNMANASFSTRFYPNPVQTVLIIEGLTGKNKAEVINAAGQLLMIKTLTNTTGINSLDLSSLPGGTYLLRITTTDGNTMTTKIIKD